MRDRLRTTDIDAVLSNHAANTQHLRDLQTYAQWSSAFQLVLLFVDNALFLVRRQATLVAFDPVCEHLAHRT